LRQIDGCSFCVSSKWQLLMSFKFLSSMFKRYMSDIHVDAVYDATYDRLTVVEMKNVNFIIVLELGTICGGTV
jgi:hypothetical protein